MTMVIRRQIFKIWNLFLDVDGAPLVLTRLLFSLCRESRKMWTKAPSIQICSCWSLRKEKKVRVLWEDGPVGGLHVAVKGRAEKRKPSCHSGCRVDGQCTGHPHPWAGQARPSINNAKCPQQRQLRSVHPLGSSGWTGLNTLSNHELPFAESGNHSFLVLSLVLLTSKGLMVGYRLLDHLTWGWHPQRSLLQVPL